MKAIVTFVTLLFIIAIAVSSEVLYLNENYILSASLCVSTVLSVSLCINYTGINLLNLENNEQHA
ncbi:MAG TPA: hypothetical protein VHT72_10270 [Puia sp.]|nr:hypothetical protein [Puia sp.]